SSEDSTMADSSLRLASARWCSSRATFSSKALSTVRRAEVRLAPSEALMSGSPGIADELSASSRYQDLGRGPACAISQLSVAYYLRPEHPHPLVEWRIGDLPFVLACKEAPSLSRLNRAACQSVCGFSLCRALRLRSIGKTKRNVEPPLAPWPTALAGNGIVESKEKPAPSYM